MTSRSKSCIRFPNKSDKSCFEQSFRPAACHIYTHPGRGRGSSGLLCACEGDIMRCVTFLPRRSTLRGTLIAQESHQSCWPMISERIASACLHRTGEACFIASMRLACPFFCVLQWNILCNKGVAQNFMNIEI